MTRRTMFWRMVVSSILRRRSRVLIAILAVAIGATTLSGLATIAIDVPAQIAREVRSYGANMVVSPDEDASGLTRQSLDAVNALIPQDSFIGSASFAYETILINDQPFLAAGTELDAVSQVNPYWYVNGSWPHSPKEVLIGEEIASTIGASIGDEITVSLVDESDTQSGADATPSVPMSVAGILTTGGNEDAYLYMSTDDLSHLRGSAARLDLAEYSIALEGDELSAVIDRIGAQVSGVRAQTVKRLAQSDAGVIGMLRSLLAIVTLIVLALTMIGVSTTMVAVVAERRTEIGLRKALGATSTSIAREFIGEGVLLGTLGGILGAGLGYGLASLVAINVFHRAVEPHPAIIIMTIGAAVAVAVLACLPPVRRAAAVDPALVLRGE